MPMGRPSDYTPELADTICDLFATGVSMREVCEKEGMPSPSSVYLWLSKYEDFSDKYTRAKADGQEASLDDLDEIAEKVISGDIEPNAARVAADIKKWAIVKRNPKKYGEKVDLNHGGQSENPLTMLISEISGGTLEPNSD